MLTLTCMCVLIPVPAPDTDTMPLFFYSTSVKARGFYYSPDLFLLKDEFRIIEPILYFDVNGML